MAEDLLVLSKCWSKENSTVRNGQERLETHTFMACLHGSSYSPSPIFQHRGSEQREREQSRGALYDYRGAIPRVREGKGGIILPPPLRLRKVAIDRVANREACQCLPRASGT